MAAGPATFTPAWDLARQIRAKELSPVELIDHFLERIDQLNPKLKTFITVAGEQARAAARRAEAAVVRGEELPPLHGVPIAVKDSLSTKGIRTTGGSLVHRDFVPDHDSGSVERLVKAGAIVLGKTNLPEFALGGGVSFNRIIDDDTHNPWDLDRTAGASSGGSAAAVSAGLAPVALGTDAGGSIRTPAAWCGVYGFKPTWGLVSGYGGICPNESVPLFTSIGPLSRNVRDAALMLQAMAGYDERDPFSLRQEPPDFVAALDNGFGSLTIAWSPDLGHVEVDPEIRTLTESTARLFETLGCRVEEATPAIDSMSEAFSPIALADMYAGHGEDLEKHPEELLPIIKFVLEAGKKVTGHEYTRALRGVYRIRGQMAGFFCGYDLLLTPALGIQPHKIQEVLRDYERPPGKSLEDTITFCPVANLTGGPSASIPCGFTSDGLPVGLLITGRLGEDTMVLRASAALEKVLPWADKTPPIA